jgi:3-oxoacyl-[acyl-carrier protein] reductase
VPRNYLLTGASRGLGLEIARVLLHQGDSVWAVSRSETDELRSLAKTYGAQLKLLLFDLARVDMLKGEIFDSFVTSKTPLHGFVNNAAIAYDDIVTNLNLDPLRKMFEVNVFAPMLATKFVLRNMLLHNVRGAVVHVSSISVHTGYKGLAMYAASKGALEAFSKNTAREWGERGIRSNALVAGFMETAMSGKIDAGTKSRIFARTALKKPTELRSVAETAAFLLGEGASSITGQAIHVDSGTI